MRRFFLISVIFLMTMVFLACGKKADSNVLTVGATPEPHAAMLKLIADDLKAEGITLKIVEFTDYVTPNRALEDGQLDANFFQHLPYMKDQNREMGYHLVNAGSTHIEPIALYSKKISSLADLADGATIVIPNDPTNEGRALLLLQSAGLITMDPSANIMSTSFDIVSNPKKLKFSEIEAASLPRILPDVDAAIINGNYAIPAGLSVRNDSLFVEDSSSPFVNIVAVREEKANDPRILALVNALRSQKIRDYISRTYPDGEVVPAF
ncbi:MAG: MetQ/NlpA family ABC transporter substrate-binding protein [Spirochaetia bacterium]|nr:MetQ/NlpA family ABC transporter substrate-binding protein [Spirochaetia bacterium]